MQSGAAITDASAATSRASSRGATPRLAALGYAIALALIAWPVLQVAHPVLTDYPNHLARLYVSGALPGSDALANYYSLQGGFYPYLPFDLIVGALGAVVGLETAGKLFLALSLAMPTIGTLVLARALHGKIGLLAGREHPVRLQPPPVMGPRHLSLLARLAFMVFAGWIVTEQWTWPKRLALFSILSSLMFCSHPFAFSALGLLIGAWELGRTPAWSWSGLKQTAMRLCLTGIQFIPAVVIATQVEQTDVGSSITRFGSLSARITAPCRPCCSWWTSARSSPSAR